MSVHDLNFIIQESVPTIEYLEDLEQQLCMESSLLLLPSTKTSDEQKSTKESHHLIGCAGSLAWSSSLRSSLEILTLFEDMKICTKVISNPNEFPEKVIQVKMINLPRSNTQPSILDIGIKRVLKVLIILCEDCVIFTPVQGNGPVHRVPFNPYHYGEANPYYMKPLLAIHR